MACNGTASVTFEGAADTRANVTLTIPQAIAQLFIAGIRHRNGRVVAMTRNVAATVSNLSTHRAKVAEGVSSAKAAGLRYADANAPGITRKRRGKSFVYCDARGRRVRDAKTLSLIHI